MMGTCAFIGDDGKLRIIAPERIVSFIEMKKDGDNIVLNCNHTGNGSDKERNEVEKTISKGLDLKL